jgi:DNA-dependent protein kinase catalytic subunit
LLTSLLIVVLSLTQGELPDIEIPHSALILPLEALHTEASVAKQLFVMIFRGIYEQVEKWRGAEAANIKVDLRKAVLQMIHRLNAQASSASASLVFALLTSILECGKLDPSFTATWSGQDIRALGTIAFESKSYHAGVLLLEHIIGTKSEVKKQSSKRLREDEISERHEQAYLQLARLYRELGENEIMMNLYTSFARQEYTRSAISSMLRGDWQNAMSQYDEALNRFELVQKQEAEWEGAEPSSDEIELWSDERLECLRQLTEWQSLRANVLEEIEHTPDRLWNAEYAQKGDYLRHYITSGLKTTQEFFLELSNAAAADPSGAASSSPDRTDPRTELLQFVERALASREEADQLLNYHAPDLVLLYALRGNIEHASTFLKQTYMRFLHQWVDLPQIATGPRLALLQRLQKLTEVSEFLNVEQELASAQVTVAAPLVKGAPIPLVNPASTLLAIAGRLQHQMSVWRHRLPAKTDSVESWDDIVLNRSAFLVHLRQSLEGRVQSVGAPYKKMLGHVSDQVRSELTQSVVEMYRKASSVMLKQGNVAVADKYIQNSNQLIKAHGILKTAATSPTDLAAIRQYEFLNVYSSVKIKIAHIELAAPSFGAGLSEKQQIAEKHKYAGKTVKTLHTLLQTITRAETALGPSAKDPANAYRIATIKSHLNDLLAEKLLEDSGLSKYTENRSAEDMLVEAQDNLIELSTEFQKHVAALRPGQSREEEVSQMHKQASKAYIALVRFCDQRLSQAEDHRDTCEACKSSLHCTHPLRLKRDLEQVLMDSLVKNVLEALKLGSKDARGLFPRALELMERIEDEETRKQFLRDTDVIPCWMFIQWIPQLLGVLNLQQGSLAYPILLKLAMEYPQAIVYPFNLTKESIHEQAASKATNAALKARTDKYLRAIHSHLRNKLVDQFTQALDYLAPPELKVKDLMRLLHRHCAAGDMKSAALAWREFRHRHFSTVGSELTRYFGEIYQEFSKSWKVPMDSYFGNGGQLIEKWGPNDWRKPLQLVQDAMAKKPGRSRDTGKKPLAEYTTWFAKYETIQAAIGEYIELPGQYTGECRPQPELFTRIVNFEPIVLIMASLRKPKRLTINGSDERSHNYLVKGGEDLRMDQRIEQTFTTMNEILASDPATARRQLSLRTYQVIPLTSALGMLEWVDNTAPLKGMLLTPGHVSPKIINEMTTIYSKNLYEEFKQNPAKPCGMTDAPVYYSYIKEVDKKRAVEKFSHVDRMLPSDLIARAIAKLCSTPESFLVFRSTFARSYCTFSMCSYILGIGDRHLENFLVDQTNSEIVGIDFGAGFGQGVQLSVPELMPFRYTRQFQHMLDPLRTEDILKQDMTYVMSALRDQRKKLLTTMDVFIKEPQMEWITAQRTTKQSVELGDDVAVKQADWYPRRKIRIAKSKLEGHNPAKILKLELHENRNMQSDAKLYEKCVAILRGEPHSKRSALDSLNSPADQVALLVDMAKDPNILGRTWTGWSVPAKTAEDGRWLGRPGGGLTCALFVSLSLFQGPVLLNSSARAWSPFLYAAAFLTTNVQRAAAASDTRTITHTHTHTSMKLTFNSPSQRLHRPCAL